ncbi:MAG: glycosyltransferase family 2 protein [Candidatus Omnitrophota bacterium]|nr:glycosyltransferase family 2 protein [Candidatus Omnitrophota bacterium]
MDRSLSVIVPVFNEEGGIKAVLDSLISELGNIKIPYEIIVVDDGSADSTAEILKSYKDRVGIIRHPENMGYGRSIKDGILKAKYPYIAMLDGDGSYPVGSIGDLFRNMGEYDMVVGARTGDNYKGALLKYPARLVFLWLSEFACGRRIPDVNSGFRIFKKEVVMKYFNTLCLGFSFTTTITLAMSLGGYFIKYMPIEYHKRKGASKVRYFRDTLRSLQIIVETILYYNPIKIFILLCGFLWAVMVIAVVACAFLGLDFLTLLAIESFLASFIVFGLGLIADLMRKIDLKNSDTE